MDILNQNIFYFLDSCSQTYFFCNIFSISIFLFKKMSLKVKSTSGVQILEVFSVRETVLFVERPTSNARIAAAASSHSAPFCFLLSAFWCCSMFSEHLLFPFANSCLFSLLFSSHFHFHSLNFSINFRWNLINAWNLSCLEKRTLYDSLIFGRIWNLINKWKLLRWSKNDISCYIIKANKESINVSNKLRPGMFLELRAK